MKISYGASEISATNATDAVKQVLAEFRVQCTELRFYEPTRIKAAHQLEGLCKSARLMRSGSVWPIAEIISGTSNQLK